MREWLIRRFIKDPDAIYDRKVQQRYGWLSSTVGIVVNLILFTAKFTAGSLMGSISVTADAVNNLSDAMSSVISFVSFRLSAKPADKDHPFGHARIEYLASSIVAASILFIGFELGKTSIDKVLAPQVPQFNLFTAIVLSFSIGAKLWLFGFNRHLGRRVNSTIMRATAADSMSDVMATSAVLLSMVISPLIGFQLDGYMGLLVALLIVLSGLQIMRETMDRLLGKGPTEELTALIGKFIREHEGVINIHDLLVHDYGPNRVFASVHVEVDAKVDILKSHDLIDNIELDIKKMYNINLVIHLDPVLVDDPFVNRMREIAAQAVSSVDASLTFHDFRVVEGQTHSNLIFDIIIPFSYGRTKAEISEAIGAEIRKKDSKLRAVINFDRG